MKELLNGEVNYNIVQTFEQINENTFVRVYNIKLDIEILLDDVITPILDELDFKRDVIYNYVCDYFSETEPSNRKFNFDIDEYIVKVLKDIFKMYLRKYFDIGEEERDMYYNYIIDDMNWDLKVNKINN